SFLTVVSLSAFIILFFGAASVASLFGNPSIVLFLQVVSFSFLLSPLRIISLLMTSVHVRLVDQALYPMVEEVAKTAALIICFYVLSLGPLGVFYAFLASQAAAILLFSLRTYSGYQVFAGAVSEGSREFWRILGSHRKWSVAAGYAGTLMQNAQLWIIKLMLGTEAVGLYSFATGIMSNVSSLFSFSDVLGALAPKYADDRKKLVRLITASAKAQLILSVGLIALAALLLPLLIWLLPKYSSAVSLTLLMLLVLIPTSVSGIFTPVFAALKAQFAYTISVVVKLVLTILVLPFSIFLFGLLGIAASSILINILSTLERYLRLRRVGLLLDFSLREFMKISPEERSAFLEIVGKIPLLARVFRTSRTTGPVG
ncbi:MAG: oligosaccharide flippase family protein, partial [Minisyncoccia bacterium]